MRIVQLTPGSGDNFYCENCLRDLTLVRAMRALGHEVTLVPMYLPLQIRNPEPIDAAPIFFGGINVYLQQKLGLFRRLPRWLDRWLDSPLLLRRIAKLSSMTSARDLGETTLSMLEGSDGHQRKESDRLIDFLAGQDEKPDVILLSNLLLSGLAEALGRRLKTPVVCLLQDEDGFLDSLGAPWSKQAWQKVRDNAAHIDHFFSASRYFRQVMIERAGLMAEKVSVLYTGIEIDDTPPVFEPPRVPTIGYLSRMCKENGLDVLVEAFALLRQEERFRNAQLKITGGSLHSDAAFLETVKARTHRLNLADCITFEADYSRKAKKALLGGLSVVAVPARKPMACGLFALEAMACGVPFVQPDCGVFTELAEHGAGVVYKTNTAEGLAETLRTVLTDAPRLAALQAAARHTAKTLFAVEKTTAQMAEQLSRLERQRHA